MLRHNEFSHGEAGFIIMNRQICVVVLRLDDFQSCIQVVTGQKFTTDWQNFAQNLIQDDQN